MRGYEPGTEGNLSTTSSQQGLTPRLSRTRVSDTSLNNPFSVKVISQVQDPPKRSGWAQPARPGHRTIYSMHQCPSQEKQK